MKSSTNSTRERICAGLLLLAAVFALPSYLALAIGAIFTFRYSHYFEFAVAALLVDACYRPYPGVVVGIFGFAVAYILVVDVLRERLRAKRKDTL